MQRQGRGAAALRLDAAAGSGAATVSTAALALATLAFTGSLLSAVVASLASAAGWALYADRRARRRGALIQDLERAARRVREGGRLEHLDTRSLGRLAGIGDGFNHMLDALGSATHRVLGIVHRVRDLPERISRSMAEVEASAAAQEEAVEETASLLANINTSIRDINDQVENLARASEESASSILQMASSVDEVARNAGSLHKSVETSTSAVHEMGASIRQVADGAEVVQRMAEETASSMIEMDRTVQQVGEHVKEASLLTGRVRDGAEQGAEAVAATIEDIVTISTLTLESRTVLERLVSRIVEIGDILRVMGEINDETNLLSLNAAIIAAQAGEQGKAFLVVANHVKTLAQRTASSTEDIERLLRAVQQESDNAVTAMSAGTEAIEQGVARSRLAGEALGAIRNSAIESNERVAEIARATEEQTRSSRLVARATQETSNQVQQISAAISEQSKASEQMLQSSEEALDMCRHVHRSTEEQRETGRYITSSIASITEMIGDIQEGTENHARASKSVSDAVTWMLDNARQSAQHIPEVKDLMTVLKESAESISAEVGPFESVSRPRGGNAQPPASPASATAKPAQ